MSRSLGSAKETLARGDNKVTYEKGKKEHPLEMATN